MMQLATLHHLVRAQVHEPRAIGLDGVLQHILLAEHLHLVGEHAEHGALARLALADERKQALVGLREVVNGDEVVLDEIRAEEPVCAHEEGAVFGGGGHGRGRGKIAARAAGGRLFSRGTATADAF